MAADESESATRAEAGPPAAAQKGGSVRRWTLVILCVILVLFGYSLIADRLTPYTSQARVEAFVVLIAPDVAGRVAAVAVDDNQLVKAGQVLFQIDPERYEIAVRQAEAQLAAAGQSVGASTAGVASAEAKLVEAEATLKNVREQANRVFALVKSGTYAKARGDQAQGQLSAAEATVDQAKAELEKARQALGPQGQDNPEIRQAMAALARAQRDLADTTVLAPADGLVTNLQLSAGQFAAVGQPALSFIDIRSVWITADLRENSLENLANGDPAAVVLDVLPGRVFPARVDTIGWGVAYGGTDKQTGLPTISNQTGLIRAPQRFPVRLVLDTDKLPRGVRVGSQANVLVYAGDNPVTNGIGWVWIRLIALLTYVT